MKLQKEVLNTTIKTLTRRFARKKGPSSVLINTRIKEAPIFQYPNESYKTSEPFFPEFISTLGHKEFVEFFEKHNGQFSYLSWILSYKRVIELIADGTNDELSSLKNDISDKVFNSLDKMNTKEFNILLNIEAENNIVHDNFIDQLQTKNTKIESSLLLLIYLLKSTDVNTQMFKRINDQLKAEYVSEGKINVDNTQYLTELLDIYCVKLQNIELSEMLEKQLLERKEAISLSNAFMIVKIYARNVIKQPNITLLDHCLYELSENLANFDVSIIMKLYEYMNAIKAENEHFLVYLTKRYLEIYQKQIYPDDFDVYNNTALALYILHKLDVN